MAYGDKVLITCRACGQPAMVAQSRPLSRDRRCDECRLDALLRKLRKRRAQGLPLAGEPFDAAQAKGASDGSDGDER